MGKQATRGWRFEELAALAARLVDAEGDSRRVQWVPGPRTLRYYTTLGLLDRPLFFRGRTAYYGRRHLAQVVLIKRLQAAGASLAEVQRRMAGLTEADLAALARLPSRLPEPSGAGEPVPSRPDAESFWHTAPARPPRREAAATGGAGPAGVYVTIAPGATLFLEGLARVPTASDLDAILRAAKPLVDELRGLTRPRKNEEGDDDVS